MKRYHMNRRDRRIENSETINAILREGRFATLALCRRNEPYVLTMNHGFDPAAHALYFHCARQGLKLDFLAENRQVCGTVVIDHGYRRGECSHDYRSVVFSGRLSVVDDEKEIRHGLEVLIEHQEDHPAEVKQRLLEKKDYTVNLSVLRLDIDWLTGKGTVD